jgi:hypothetical protein
MGGLRQSVEFLTDARAAVGAVLFLDEADLQRLSCGSFMREALYRALRHPV